jgi:hypothetical protein
MAECSRMAALLHLLTVWPGKVPQWVPPTVICWWMFSFEDVACSSFCYWDLVQQLVVVYMREVFP